jgi:hypothetical protein
MRIENLVCKLTQGCLCHDTQHLKQHLEEGFRGNHSISLDTYIGGCHCGQLSIRVVGRGNFHNVSGDDV